MRSGAVDGGQEVALRVLLLPGAEAGDCSMTHTTSTPRRTRLRLAALPTAAACARLHAKQLSWEWRLGDLTDRIELLVSELVTNAVRASQPDALPPGPAGVAAEMPWVELRLSADGQRVLIEVWDENPRPPVRPTAEPDGMAEHGRGLLLVQRLTQRWGFYYAQPMPDGFRPTQPSFTPVGSAERIHVGKVVWCEVLVGVALPD